MNDVDFPFAPRVISDEEFENLPKNDQPEEVDPETPEEKTRKIALEKTHGHPAFAVRDEYKSRGEKVDD